MFCLRDPQKKATIAAIYSEPLGEESDGLTLLFPCDCGSNSSVVEVTPRRIGRHTLIFETPG